MNFYRSLRPLLSLFLASHTCVLFAEAEAATEVETEIAEVSTTSVEEISSTSPKAEVQAWGHPHVDLGIGTYTFSYKEDVPLPYKSTETGVMKALSVSGLTRLSPALYLQAMIEGATTNTLYDGSLQDGTPAVGDTSNIILRTQLVLGTRLLEHSFGDLTAYAGFGYRLWKRDLQGPTGYLEDYKMWSIPVGVVYRHFINDGISVASDFSMRLGGGSVKAYLSKFNSQDLNLPLGERVGFRLAAPVTFWSLLGANTSLVVTPWYDFIGIGLGDRVPIKTISGELIGNDTDGYLAGREPASDTHQFGITGSISFGL